MVVLKPIKLLQVLTSHLAVTFESLMHEPPAHEPSVQVSPMHDSVQPRKVLYSAGSEPVDPRAQSLANALNRAEGDAIDAYSDEDDPFFCDGDDNEQGKSYRLMNHSIQYRSLQISLRQTSSATLLVLHCSQNGFCTQTKRYVYLDD